MVGSSLMRAGDVATWLFVTLGAALQIVLGRFIFGLQDFAGYGLAGVFMAFVLARTIGFFTATVCTRSSFGFSASGILGSTKVFHVGLPL